MTGPTSADKYIGQILKERRLALGLTGKAVAEYAGLKHAAYNRIESDPKSNPTVQTLGPIMAKLGLTFAVCPVERVCPHDHVKRPAVPKQLNAGDGNGICNDSSVPVDQW